MELMNFRGRWALVTGASSGLGLAMAHCLARDYGANVVAVARRADRLASLQAELTSRYGVQVVSIVADLTQPTDVTRIFETATAGRDLYAAILNAGVTFYGQVLEQDPATFDAMLSTNVTSVVRLSQLFSRYLADRAEGGGLMLVSSVASFAPIPFQTTYAATKSFVTSFGGGLAQELRDRNVSVTVFAPGGIATEMLELSGLSAKFKAGDLGVMDAETCARLALRAFARRRALYVPGALNKVLALAMKVVPSRLMLPQIRRTYER